ncbi:MAG: metal-sensing transcriptional repressor [Chloroflexi bacterium]|nr:metal-sensing transcriptional repressor [Chloroflexota bacterium]
MSELPVPREKVARRLRQIAGQIRGCARMVEEEKECSDILTQMAAARAALSAAAALVLTNFTHLCLEKEAQTGEKPYDSLARAFALWATGPSDAFPYTPSGQKTERKRGKKTSPRKAV